MAAIDINPFRNTSVHLINIHTGQNAAPEVHHDLTNVEKMGMKALSVLLNSDKKTTTTTVKLKTFHSQTLSCNGKKGRIRNCCCLPSETYGRNGATPIFRSFFTELPVPLQAAGVVGTFNVLDIYPSEHYGLSFFWTLRMPFFFTRSPFFFFFFCCIHFHFASTLCMCVMYLTSI